MQTNKDLGILQWDCLLIYWIILLTHI
uniref:Uncharacterized protein n=1 Tax=Rhizophora mucronata TaxID=61149 RepID=A0A2P2N1D2_RHIMU